MSLVAAYLPLRHPRQAQTHAGVGRSGDAAIRDLWRRSLGPKARDPRKSIVQIGVGLKRLVRLQKAVEDELGVRVPATALLRLGTVDALIAAMREQSWPASSPTLLLKDGDDRPPLYILSAGSGLVLELCELAQVIDYPGQIWGLQLPGLDGEAEPLADLREIGGHFAKAITARQPAGPYHLVGYSFGGSAAVETARHLAAAGGSIGLLGLIDSNLDERHWPRRAWLLGVMKRCVWRVADARHLPPNEAVQHIALRAVSLVRYVARKLSGETAATVHRSAYYIGGFDPDFQKVRDCSIAAYQSYWPGPLALKVTLFRSAMGDPRACDPVPVLRQFLSRLEVVESPGSHTTMVRLPHARTLAAQILARL